MLEHTLDASVDNLALAMPAFQAFPGGQQVLSRHRRGVRRRQGTGFPSLAVLPLAVLLAMASVPLPLPFGAPQAGFRLRFPGPVVSFAQVLAPGAEDPFALVDAVVPRLSTIAGGEMATAITLDETSQYPLVSAPVADSGRGVLHGFVTLEEQWVFDSTFVAPGIVSGDDFGAAITNFGNITAVGAPRTDVDGKTDAGIVYVFNFKVLPGRDPQWTYVAPLIPPDAASFDLFGSSVSTDGTSVVVGAPFADHSGFGNTGKAYVWRNSVWGSADAVVLQAPDARISDSFGNAVAVDRDTVAVSAWHRDGPSPAFIRDIGQVYVFRTPDDGASWVFDVSLNPEGDRSANRLFGSAIWVSAQADVSRLLVGSPGSNALGGSVLEAGVAYMYLFDRNTSQWSLESVLSDPIGPETGDRFGSQVVILAETALISAPGRGSQDTGAAYLFRKFNGSDWFPRVRLTAQDATLEDQFGLSVAMGTDRAIIGTPRKNTFQGAVYQYDGPEFFPIDLPTFAPPVGVYFVEEPFEVFIAASKPFQENVYYEIGAENFPATLDSPIVINGSIFLEPITGIYDLTAFSANRRFRSFEVSWSYEFYRPTPGMYWVPSEQKLKACGSPEYYCPGVPGDNTRHTVTGGYYTLPVDTPDRRTHQLPCDIDSFCIAGIRFSCPTVVCWPLPVKAEAAEGGPYEEGLGDGDTITITFNKPTNFANVTGDHRVRDMFNFTAPIGVELDGRWFNDTVLILTIVNSSGAADPEITRIGAIGFGILETGGLKMEQNRTVATRFSEPFPISGTWGKVDPPPEIASAVAKSGKQPQGGYGPGTLDTLTITLTKIVNQPPIGTQADIDNLLQFDPPFTDVNYTGEWLSWTSFRITFWNLTEREPLPWPAPDNLRSSILHRVPDLFVYGGRSWPTEPTYRAEWQIGKMGVYVRPTAFFLSRDQSSDRVPNNTVTLTGSWGDQPGRVNTNYDSPSSFYINWLPSQSAFGYNVERYFVQVRADVDFATPLPYEPTEDPSEALVLNATVEADPSVEASNEDYRFLLSPVDTGRRYYVRVFSWNSDDDWGPPRASDPLYTVPRRVQVLRVKAGQNLPLYGGLVLLETSNVGTGPFVGSLPVSAKMVNGTGGRAYEAFNCEFDISGEQLICDTPDGVGGDFQWQITANGHLGDISPRQPATMSSYFPPVVAGFVSETTDLFMQNRTDLLVSAYISGTGAASAPHLAEGNELFRIYGTNFGRVDLSWGIRAWYWPRDHPEVVTSAYGCIPVVDHVQINCFTSPGTGGDIEWAVSVAGQSSGVPLTSYEKPIITSVYHQTNISLPVTVPNPVNATQPVFNTGGGERIIITGENFGPAREDVVPIVAAVSQDLIGTVPGDYRYLKPENAQMASLFDEVWPDTHPKFVSRSCEILQAQTKILCHVPEGFGGPLEWAVHLVGVTSEAFETPGLSYDLPRLDALAIIRVNVTTYDNSTSTVTETITSVLDHDAALQDPTPNVRTSGTDREWAVYGGNLAGGHPENVRVVFRGIPLTVRPISHSELRVILPPGTGVGHELFVSVAGRATPETLTIDYAPPALEAFSLQEMRGFLIGGVLRQLPCIHVEGINFGGNTINRTATPDKFQLTIEEVPCHTIEHVEHTSALCCSTVSAGIVRLTVDGQEAFPKELVVQDLDEEPVLSSITPTSGPTNGGTVITLRGRGFLFPIAAQVRLEGFDMTYDPKALNTGVTSLVCNLVEEVPSDTRVRCIIPAGHGPLLRVSVIRNSVLGLGVLRSLQALEFHYDPPDVVYTYPTRIPDGGGVLTIIGHSFGMRGHVIFRGLTDTQDKLTVEEDTPPNRLNVTELLESTSGVTATRIEGEDGVQWAALPRCSPVLVWTHNRIECFANPAAVPKGAMEVNVGWTRSQTLYPGMLFETDKAGQLEALSVDDILFAHVNPQPDDRVGAIYYPNQVIVQDNGSPRTLDVSTGLVVCLLSTLAATFAGYLGHGHL